MLAAGTLVMWVANHPGRPFHTPPRRLGRARRIRRWSRVGSGRERPVQRGRRPGSAGAPLAVRMRPRTLDDVVGQGHLLEPGSPLRRLVDPTQGPAGPASVVLWGPPGTGKTTLAHVVSNGTGGPVRRAVRDHRGRAGRARGDGRRPRRPRAAPPGHRAVPGRDPPLHQGPAGRAAARRGEPLGGADRRDHGEPVVLGGLAAAVPVPGADPAPAGRRRGARADRARGGRPARAGRRRSS